MMMVCVHQPIVYHRNRLMDIDFEERYGFLYADYKPSYFSWDSIVMLRKLAMVVIVVFMNNGPKDGLTTYEVPVALGVIIFTTSIQVGWGLVTWQHCKELARPEPEGPDRFATTSEIASQLIHA